MIYADEQYDNLKKDLEKKRKFKKMQEICRQKIIQWGNDNKTEDAILKRFKHTKDSKNKPWRHRIKLGLKHREKRSYCLRKTAFNKKTKEAKKITKRQDKRVVTPHTLYNTLVRSVLLQNSIIWGLSRNDEKALDRVHIKLLSRIAGVQY